MGVSLGALSTYVQFRRARDISTDGISLTTWYQFMLMSVFWISYGLAVRQVVIIAGSAVVLPMQVSIVSRLRPAQHRATLYRSTAFVACCALVPTVLFGWSAGVLGTGVAMIANRLPQIWTLVRHPGDFGVSASSWLVGAACSAMWIIYYLGAHLLAALVVTAGAMAGNLAIASLAYWRHHQVRDGEFAVAAV